MQKSFVLTLTGPDRIGVVDNLTEIILKHGGNVETSRMARLGGAFAVLMLVDAPAAQYAGMEKDFSSLVAKGYKFTLSPTEQASTDPHPDWLLYQITVHGADHEGIIYEVAHYLAQHTINIESVETAIKPAPHSGTPLFTMIALVMAPPDMPSKDWEAGLDDIGHRLNLDIEVVAK
jgi:glycine cleavage system transcriptional repressor